MKGKVLVTGGNGFIGQHVVQRLDARGESTILVDIRQPTSSRYIQTFLCEDFVSETVEHKFQSGTIETVIHLAAENFIPPSMEDPSLYYEQNVVKTKTLLDFCIKYGVANFIFASSSSVYGSRHKTPTECWWAPDDDTVFAQACSPYAKSKIMAEQLIQDYAESYPMFRTAILRPFNVVGTGYWRDPPVHFIPLLFKKILDNDLNVDLHTVNQEIMIADGSHTCRRTFTDVRDIASGFVRALDFLRKLPLETTSTKPLILDLCNRDNYFSMDDVVDLFESLFDVKFERHYIGSRKGNVNFMQGNQLPARDVLNWSPIYTLEESIKSMVGEHPIRIKNKD